MDSFRKYILTKAMKGSRPTYPFMACGSKAEGRVSASRSRAVVKCARSPDLPHRLEGFSDLIYEGGFLRLGRGMTLRVFIEILEPSSLRPCEA